MELMSAMPARDASTAINFLTLNLSTLNMAPKMSVKTELVLVRIVLEATVVYSRHAETK